MGASQTCAFVEMKASFPSTTNGATCEDTLPAYTFNRRGTECDLSGNARLHWYPPIHVLDFLATRRFTEIAIVINCEEEIVFVVAAEIIWALIRCRCTPWEQGRCTCAVQRPAVI